MAAFTSWDTGANSSAGATTGGVGAGANVVVAAVVAESSGAGGGVAYWAHIGDSRIYHVRRGRIAERTRDHSHVEFLIREGLINEQQAQAHPMRNFVECCVGGESLLPEMTITGRRQLEPGDVLLVCSDGLWGALDDQAIAQPWTKPGETLTDALNGLARRAIAAAGPGADNTTGVVLRWLGPA